MTALAFALDSTALLTGTELPEDFETVVSQKGDQFRDAFTRACLYLANKHRIAAAPALTTVVVGTEYGNLDAMLRLQRQAHAGARRISAQQFPHSTTSSASVFLNLEQGITGGNVTLNAGGLTPLVALLQALLHVTAYPDAAGCVLVGDTYCDEALDDVRKNHRQDRPISPGVLWAGVRSGDQFEAEFTFGATETPDPGQVFDDADGDLNRAILTHSFLRAAAGLGQGQRVVLRLRQDDHLAQVAITRKRT